MVKMGLYSSKSSVVKAALIEFFNGDGKQEVDDSNVYKIIKREIADFIDCKRKYLAKRIAKKYGLSINSVAVSLSYFVRNLKKAWKR